jgi:tripartite-type tricarboxylate transporter receptor subunit TctC
MFLRVLHAVLAILICLPAIAQDAFPSKPIRLVVGYTPGGVTDIAARALSIRMSEGLGQSVVVENRGGAAGAVGAEFVRRSAPDGYTLLLSPNGPMTVMPAISTSTPYSPTRDFLAVSMAGSFPLILVVNSARPIRSVKELIEYGKKQPDQANYAGSGTMIQLASELFNLRSGSRFVHVPYKGSGDSITALLSDQVTMAMMDAAPATGPLKSGKLRGLAVTSAERLPAWPDLPTMAEAGLSDMVITPWVGFFAPLGTPQPVVKRLQDEVKRVVQLPDVKSRLESLGITPTGTSSEEFTRIVASDLERFTAIAKAANIKAD